MGDEKCSSIIHRRRLGTIERGLEVTSGHPVGVQN